MSEFITIQIGQCGNQIGSAFWPLALHEHGIYTKSGNVNLLKTQQSYLKHTNDLSEAMHSFFHIPDHTNNSQFKNLADLRKAKVKARAVLIDMEDSVVSRYKQGPMRDLFDETCMITNYPGSGNNWAMGYHIHGKEYHEQLQETIRRASERCDQLHGFLIMHSLGGGTGSGLGTATLKLLSEDFPRVDRFVSCVYPTGTQDVVTAPYNVLLATNEIIEYATCVFPVDNRALLDICHMQSNIKDNLDQLKYNTLSPPFQDMNSAIVNMILHLTSGSRFPGTLNMDMNDLRTNLVPYPKLHYIFSSVSPISLTASLGGASNQVKCNEELFTNAWSRNHQLIKVDPLQCNSTVLGAAHILRGNSSLINVTKNIQRFKKKAKFTKWSRDMMKIGLCSIPPAGHTASVLCLINSTAMRSLFTEIVKDYSKLFKSGAHVHHYTQIDGFEKVHFSESEETILNLCEHYKEIENQELPEIPRLQLI